jgi:hypothetical protein
MAVTKTLFEKMGYQTKDLSNLKNVVLNLNINTILPEI